MATNLPIYSSLIKDCDDKDLSLAQKNMLIKRIQNLDCDGMELVYAIIIVYYIENENVTNHIVLPYGGNCEGTNINFNLEFMPNKLKQMINKFLIMHNKVMIENSEKFKK